MPNWKRAEPGPVNYEEEIAPVTPDEIWSAVLSGRFSPMSQQDHDAFPHVLGEGYHGQINGWPIYLDHREDWGVIASVPGEDGTWSMTLATPAIFERDEPE